MPSVLVDTGLWIALFDPRDSHHQSALEVAERLETMAIVIAWPVLYETLNTRFVRRPHIIRQFEQVLKRPGSVLLDDAAYREEALDLVFDASLHRSRPLSLADCVLRLMLADTALRFDYLATFNVGDFSDVCRHRRVTLL